MTLHTSTLRYMIEHMPLNILICDAKNLIITYANKRSRDMLDTMSELLPKGIRGDTIIGQCIDIFHKNPQHQRRIVSDGKSLPHKATIRLGKEFLNLDIIAVPGALGKDQLMLTWAVVTQVERLKRMVDKMPINIMMADPDTLEVVFMNETSLTTLRTVEHLLPVKAEHVVGSCIDIFHKHPERQRAMLADPKNLPYRTKIQLGTEWLELNVAAIVDNQGAYIGPMLSWSVVTSQVKVAETVQRIAASVAMASSALSSDADMMGVAVHSATQQAVSASAASEQTSSNVQAVASAAEQMSASVSDIASNMAKSKIAVERVVDDANKADTEAQALAGAAESMGNIISLIEKITGQINLLALNATIEAARAGEAGKGFAVVANEVKMLANQTAKATQNISLEIAQMQKVASSVIQVLDAIKLSIDDMNMYVTAVAGSIEEQSAVTQEISSNMQSASQGVGKITQDMTGIAASTEQTNQATLRVQNAAKTLSAQAHELNTEIGVLLR